MVTKVTTRLTKNNSRENQSEGGAGWGCGCGETDRLLVFQAKKPREPVSS